MKKFATWSLIWALACPPQIFAQQTPVPSPAHVTPGNRPQIEATGTPTPRVPLSPEHEALTRNPMCSETETREQFTLVRSLIDIYHPTYRRRVMDSSNHWRSGGGPAKYETVTEKDKFNKRLHPSFEHSVTELMAWALKCRAARGATAKPTWLELELIKTLKESLPKEIGSLRINGRSTSEGIKYTSDLATSAYREDVLFLRQLADTFDHVLQSVYKDTALAEALAEQFDEYSKARKEGRDPKQTEKLKALTKQLSQLLKAAQTNPQLLEQLTPGQSALLQYLMGEKDQNDGRIKNKFNEHPDRQEPPIFDTVLGNYLGAAYRALLLNGEPTVAADAKPFSWDEIPLEKPLVDTHLHFVTKPKDSPNTRNGLRNSRGNSPATEYAPFWAYDKQKFAEDIFQRSWDDRERLRNWIREKISDFQQGKVKDPDPLALESLVQMARVIDSSADMKRPKGSRISPSRPELPGYYAGILAEARTAADPKENQIFRDLELVRKAFEKKAEANLSNDARWKFMTLPLAERTALTHWSQKTGDKEALQRLLSNPNRTDIVIESGKNHELAQELYGSAEALLREQVGDWTAEDKASLFRILRNLKNQGTGSAQEESNHQEELRRDGEQIRKKLGDAVVSLSEKSKSTPSAHGAADAAAMVYNRLSEMRLSPDQIRHLDIQATDPDGKPTAIADHYGHETTAQSIKSNPRDLFEDAALKAFIEEIYGKDAVIPDSTRRILKTLMSKDHDIHRTMLRRINDIIKHRLSLVDDNDKSKPRELWRSLLARPTPDMIEAVLKKLNGDAFRLYADVEQYQAIRQGLQSGIKRDPSKFSATTVGKEQFFQLAKYGIAQNAALTGTPMDRVVTDDEVTARARKDIADASAVAQQLAAKGNLSEDEKKLVARLEEAFKLSGSGDFKGARALAEGLEALRKRNEGKELSETEMRLVMLLDADLGNAMNEHYVDISRDAAREILSNSNDESSRQKALGIVKSQFGATLRPLNADEEKNAVQDLINSAERTDRLAGHLDAFAQQDLLPNVYKKRYSKLDSLSQGLESYYGQVDLLQQLELENEKKRSREKARELWQHKFGHREDPVGNDDRINKQSWEEKRKHGDIPNGSTVRADTWLADLGIREKALLDAEKTIAERKKTIEAISAAKDKDIDKILSFETPLKLAHKFLTNNDPALREKIQRYLISEDIDERAQLLKEIGFNPQLAGRPVLAKAELAEIADLLKHSGGKDPKLVFQEISNLLAGRHIDSLKTTPFIRPATATNQSELRAGYNDFTTSIFNNQQELSDRAKRRNGMIEKLIDEKYSDVLSQVTDPKAKADLRNALGEEIMKQLSEKGLLEEQVRVYGRGMQTNLDINELNPNDSAKNLKRDYNANVENRLKRALGSTSKPIRMGQSDINARLKESFHEGAKDRAEKDKAFQEARKKWEAIGGEFDGLNAVLSNGTDLSALNTPLHYLRGAAEARAKGFLGPPADSTPSRAHFLTGGSRNAGVCNPPDQELMRTSQAYRMMCAGWKFEDHGKAGNKQLDEVLKDISEAGAGLTVNIPGLREFHTNDPIGTLHRIARDLAINNRASTSQFLMPVNANTAMEVKINPDTGEMTMSQSYLPEKEGELKACIEKVNQAYSVHYRAASYAKTWSHTLGQVRDNLFGVQWTRDGFGDEASAYNTYIRAIQDCRQYGTVSADGTTARDFVDSEMKYRVPATIATSRAMANEVLFKLDVVEDSAYFVAGTIVTLGAGAVLSSSAAGIRAAQLANTATKLTRAQRLILGADGLMNGKMGLDGVRQGVGVAKGLLRESAMGQAFNLFSAPQYIGMNMQLSSDYSKAEELYRTGKFNLAGFGGDQEKWMKFKQSVDQDEDGIPDSLTSFGAQWVVPDAASADSFLGSSINFGVGFGALSPITHALKIPGRLHVPLFAGGAIDRLRAVAHGRKTWREYGEDQLDSMIHLTPGLIAMELPGVSKALSYLGGKVGVPNLAEKQPFFGRGPSLGRMGDTFTTLMANHYGGEYALEALGRVAPHGSKKEEKTLMDYLANDLPAWTQELYFASKMAGKGQMNYLRGELRNLGPRPAERLAALEKAYGKGLVLAAAGSMPASEIYKAAEKNPELYKLASQIGGQNPELFRDALEIHQNRENSEVLKRQGLDAKKLYQEGGKKTSWWEKFKAPLVTTRNFMETFTRQAPLQEALPQVMREHAETVIRAYGSTNDMAFREQLVEYMRRNPIFLENMPVGTLSLGLRQGADFSEWSDKQKMDAALLYGMAHALGKRGLSDGHVDNFAAGFLHFANNQAAGPNGGTRTVGELLAEYTQEYARPDVVIREAQTNAQPTVAAANQSVASEEVKQRIATFEAGLASAERELASETDNRRKVKLRQEINGYKEALKKLRGN